MFSTTCPPLRLILSEVANPSVHTLGRLVSALPSLTALRCDGGAFDLSLGVHVSTVSTMKTFFPTPSLGYVIGLLGPQTFQPHCAPLLLGSQSALNAILKMV